MTAERPVSLYLVVPPSDISRTRPLVRLILNQIARRLTETLPQDQTSGRRLLLMLDEFPALGRLDFFETSLAFMAGYGVRAFLVAQSLNQIDRAYGVNHAILDNCHVRVAFAPNDERTARRLSEALGTATEIRRHRNISGSRLSAWLPHLTMSEQETPRPLLTPGEVLQLPADEGLVLVSGAPPIRARKLQYYADRNFLSRCLPAPALTEGRYADAPPARGDDWSGRTRTTDARLEKAWFDLVATAITSDESPPRTREIPLRRTRQKDRAPPDLPLFTWEPPAPSAEVQDQPAGEDLDKVVQFPGLRL
jgi:type IV secretion system protein VirD4